MGKSRDIPGNEIPGFYMDTHHNMVEDEDDNVVKFPIKKDLEKKKKKKKVGSQYKRTMDDIKESLFILNKREKGDINE